MTYDDPSWASPDPAGWKLGEGHVWANCGESIETVALNLMRMFGQTSIFVGRRT